VIVSAIFGSPSVDPLAGRPTRDGYARVFDTGTSVGAAVYERVRQKLLVIASGKVGSLVGPSRLGALQGALDNRLGDLKHVRQFERGKQFRVEGQAAIVKSNVAESVLEPAKLARGAG